MAPTTKDIFERRKSLYQKSLIPSATFSYQKCDRYLGDGNFGAKVVAKCVINHSTIIRDLCGVLYLVDDSYLIPGVIDFSIVQTTFKNQTKLFLGTAMYVDHDCDNNVEFYSLDNDLACVRAIKKI